VHCAKSTEALWDHGIYGDSRTKRTLPVWRILTFNLRVKGAALSATPYIGTS